MRKNFLSTFFALALCLSMLPTIALAEEQAGDTAAVETQISGIYKNLYYSENYEKPGEITAGGIVAIEVVTNDASAAAVTVGSVAAYWTDDAKTPSTQPGKCLYGEAPRRYFSAAFLLRFWITDILCIIPPKIPPKMPKSI